jgi:Bacterial regulatory helix-turn-helix protein, lysR family
VINAEEMNSLFLMGQTMRRPKMQNLEPILIFITVAEMGSFTDAADSLGIQKGRASTAVRKLEEDVGVRLLHRTTRSVQLTEDGRVFHARARDPLAEVDDLHSHPPLQITDHVRISCVAARAYRAKIHMLFKRFLSGNTLTKNGTFEWGTVFVAQLIYLCREKSVMESAARADKPVWTDVWTDVSWASIVAGAVVTAATSLALLALGAGLGLATVSPWSGSGVSGSTFTNITGAYLLMVAIMSSAIGGYLAARLRSKWNDIHTNEVFFRDSAHGLVAWALATVVSASLLGTAGAYLANSAASALSNGASSGASGNPNLVFASGAQGQP